MRVLHVIPSLSEVHGGPSRALRLIETALMRQGIEVETATTDDEGAGRRSGKPLGVPIQENGAIRRYFRKTTDPYKTSVVFARWIRSGVRDYDLVHIHALFSFTSTVTARASRRSGTPYIVRPLGTLNRYGVTQRRPLLKRLSMNLIEGPILRKAAAVHFTSNAEQVEAEALGVPLRSVVIPLGIEPQPVGKETEFLERYPELKERRRILFLSRLDPKKNVEGLLRACNLCARDLPDIRLVIAGDGLADYIASLKSLTEQLGLSDRVVWTGYLDGGIKAGAFAAADLYVLPSFSENFGIAAAEALMAGLPCVLGRGVALADEVEGAGAGLGIDPEPASVAGALVRIMKNEPLRLEMSGRAMALAREKYAMEAMGKNLVTLYEDILSRQGAVPAEEFG